LIDTTASFADAFFFFCEVVIVVAERFTALSLFMVVSREEGARVSVAV
jgi:hypothetical protein